MGHLLARHGRADEAFVLLSTGIDDHFLVQALVDIAGLAGRDEDTAELLLSRTPAGQHGDGARHCRGLDPDTASVTAATSAGRGCCGRTSAAHT
ncbi:hypothetical protein [Kitasatospora sp. NPDC059673]|uniref:hypothetical protein n=1 Tax=Kitasatospora sp. NPDC059673 TaxID=3346901 RepID=UPI0036A0B605